MKPIKRRKTNTSRLRQDEIDALQTHRLENDMTYLELAKRIGVALSRMHNLLHNPRLKANERTLFKARRYLASVTQQKVAS